jgi:small subunit ribosomal protein S20
MANSRTSRKRVRQNTVHRARNRWRLKALREAVKEFADKQLHGSVQEAQDAFRKACRLLDKSAGKGVIHGNTASRTKSRLSARMKAKQGAK